MSSNQSTTNYVPEAWSGDLLNRHDFAVFFVRVLVGLASRAEGEDGGGATVCIDGEWGTGKSYFLAGFLEVLRQHGHGAVLFNAWAHDLGDGGAAPLMAVIDEAIDAEIKGAGLTKTAVVRAQQSWKEATNRLARSLVPVSKVIAKGLLRKSTGVAVDELSQALGGGDPGYSDSVPAIDSTLDTWMDSMLASHRERVHAVAEFRQKISETIDVLSESGTSKRPFFVLIDELDRCRPTYSLSLLEEMKHLFRARGICFVVATNIDQLANSVRAVYGGEFDGRGYLDRFFDRRYVLPIDSERKFASCEIGREFSRVNVNPSFVVGLPEVEQDRQLQSCFALIDRAFHLDFRVQKKVIRSAADVISAFAPRSHIHALWLFYLCALWHTSPDALAKLEALPDSAGGSREFLRRLMKEDPAIEFWVRDESHRPTRGTCSLTNVLDEYITCAATDLYSLQSRQSRGLITNYPKSIANHIASELPNPFNPDEKYWASIRRYPLWIRYAGRT